MGRQRRRYQEDNQVLPFGTTLTSTYRGVHFEISRNRFGQLCGYTYLKPDSVSPSTDLTVTPKYLVHGGITYHYGTKIGFDTTHAGDWSPSSPSETAIYKDRHFVVKELCSLIDQILDEE